jgi:predicted transcriptional regulator
MAKSVTFRIEEKALAMIDHFAVVADRDRSYVLNEAVGNYLDVKQWHAEQIRLAVAGADAGEFASNEEVEAAFAAFNAHS